MKRQNFVKTLIIGLMAIVFLVPSLSGAREIGGSVNCTQGSDDRMVCGGDNQASED